MKKTVMGKTIVCNITLSFSPMNGGNADFIICDGLARINNKAKKYFI